MLCWGEILCWWLWMRERLFVWWWMLSLAYLGMEKKREEEVAKGQNKAKHMKCEKMKVCVWGTQNCEMNLNHQISKEVNRWQ
jgi:hypothetical protein